MKEYTPETNLKYQVKDWLNIKGIYFNHILQGVGVFKGIEDLQIFHNGKFYAVEFKSKHGELSEYQIERKANLEKNGITYIVCRSLEDIMKIL